VLLMLSCGPFYPPADTINSLIYFIRFFWPSKNKCVKGYKRGLTHDFSEVLLALLLKLEIGVRLLDQLTLHELDFCIQFGVLILNH
jgi:hypothetical protein